MQKKVARFFLLTLVLVLFLTGCVNADYHITVNMNGSGKYELKVLTNPLILPQFDRFKNSLQEKKYKIVPIEKGNQKGWIATKEVKSIADEPPNKDFQDAVNTTLYHFSHRVASASVSDQSLASSPMFAQELGKGIRMENSLFTTKFIVDTEADLTHIGENTGDLLGLDQLIWDQLNLNFILTLPVKVDEHNATSVSDGGKTLTWKIKPGEKNPIHMVVKIPNFLTWGIIIIIGIILLIIWMVRSLRRRKNRRRQQHSSSLSRETFQPRARFEPTNSDQKPSDSKPDSFRWD